MTNMLAAKRIVVGVDGTAAAAAAVNWAVREARLRHAIVHLVYARHRDLRLHAPYAPPPQALDQDEYDAAAREELGIAADLARRRLPPDRLMAELADDDLPARALLDRAAGAEMLVLGTARPSGQRAGQPQEPIGAVARDCVNKAPCPVVIVALEEDPVP